MHDGCNICNEINNDSINEDGNELHNLIRSGETILWKNKYFTIIPSVGPLNHGHVMIIPNRHIISYHFLSLEERNSLSQIKRVLRKYNQMKFNTNTEFFEHGTGTDNNYCGSCISHAHLHSIPVNYSIKQFLNKLNMWKINKDTLYDSNIDVKNGYLLVQDIYYNYWFNNIDIFPSQILRKYYSMYLVENKQWDWRIYPNISLLKGVINNYADFPIFYKYNFDKNNHNSFTILSTYF